MQNLKKARAVIKCTSNKLPEDSASLEQMLLEYSPEKKETAADMIKNLSKELRESVNSLCLAVSVLRYHLQQLDYLSGDNDSDVCSPERKRRERCEDGR